MRCRQEFKEILTAAGYWENASSQRSFSWSISLIWYHLFDSTIFLTDWEGRLKSSIRTWKIWLQNWRRFFTWEVSMKLQIVAQLWHMGKDLWITIMKYLMFYESQIGQKVVMICISSFLNLQHQIWRQFLCIDFRHEEQLAAWPTSPRLFSTDDNMKFPTLMGKTKSKPVELLAIVKCK